MALLELVSQLDKDLNRIIAQVKVFPELIYSHKDMELKFI